MDKYLDLLVDNWEEVEEVEELVAPFEKYWELQKNQKMSVK